MNKVPRHSLHNNILNKKKYYKLSACMYNTWEEYRERMGAGNYKASINRCFLLCFLCPLINNIN